MKLKKGDKVIVVLGKDKKRKGVVEKVFPKKDRVLISGINMYKKHVKKTQEREGGIIEFAKPIRVNKVALICPKCGEKTRTGVTLVEKKKKRICRKCQAIID